VELALCKVLMSMSLHAEAAAQHRHSKVQCIIKDDQR
jgi:hypothetical protein